MFSAIPSGLSAATSPSPPASAPKDAASAAKQFEAMLIAQMLRSTHEAAGDDGDDSTNSTMMDLANQQLAQLLSDHGGLGLGAMIDKSLPKK